MSLELIHTEKAAAAVGPYSQAVKVGNMVFTSGQLHFKPENGELLEGSIEEQAALALENLKAVLEEAGATTSQVVKTTVFMQDLGKFGDVNKVYEDFFGDHKPARSCVEVAALPMGGQVEIEAIAIIE